MLVATDDARIKKAVEGFGGDAMMTRTDHRTGTDRVAEVAIHREADIYVNVQGDEPLIDPGTIDAVAAAMIEDESIRIATACAAITQKNDIMDPHVTKVVRDFDGNALYFSHAPIPWVRESSEHVAVRHWKHLGLNVSAGTCCSNSLPCLPETSNGRSNSSSSAGLKMGFASRWWETEYDAVSVDVPADIERVEKLLREGAA